MADDRRRHPWNEDTPAKHGLPKMLRYGKRYGVIHPSTNLMAFAVALQRLWEEHEDTEREERGDDDT